MSKEEPKFAKIDHYWDKDTVDKVAELLREYEYLFPTKFSYFKGIVSDLGVIKTTLNWMRSLLSSDLINLIQSIRKICASKWIRCWKQALLSL